MKLKLKEKDASVKLASKDVLNNAEVKMVWNTAQDFDLGVAYIAKDGRTGFVYFGNKGSLNVFPHIMLDHDAGIGDTVDSGGNSETLTIGNITDHQKLYILCWDYGAIGKGQSARFKEADEILTIKTNSGIEYEMPLDDFSDGNVVALAEIDNSGDKPELINKSLVIQVGSWGGRNSFEEFIDQLHQQLI